MFKFADVDLDQIALAWELSKRSLATNIGKQRSGEWSENIPYYSLDINDKKFDGERPFEARWKLITKHINYHDKKFLEFGINMGLFSSFLLKHGAQSCVGFERDETMFNAANIFAQGLGVKPTYHNINLNDEEKWEDVLGYGYNTVLVLSVLKYMKEHDRVMTYLSHFQEIVFEGEIGKEEADVAEFKALGFQHKSMGKSERNRELFHFYKV